MEEIKWKDFDNLHVVRKLKEIIGKWWKVQLNFTDTKGFLRGVPSGKFFNPLNPISQAITSDDKGFSDCIQETRQTTVDAMGSKAPRIYRCKSGFSAISVQIKAGKNFLG